MAHTPLTPVFAGLRVGLHLLVVALLAVSVVGIVRQGDAAVPGLAVAGAFGAVYLLGARVARIRADRRRVAGAVWVLVLTALWVALLIVTPDAAYLVFPLFFLHLHVLDGWRGPALVVLATAVAITAIGARAGFTVGGVVGPLVGAGVALLIGLGYRALSREAAEREALLVELVATRDRLAASEREQGVLAERARLAREIHDTVAQGLSSIQMLLHAAERDGAMEHVRLARATAADGLAEARRFIRELSSPSLAHGLPAALARLASARPPLGGAAVDVVAPAEADLPMDVQAALLRVAQGALANVDQHAGASRAGVTLDVESEATTLTVWDDGVGFDPSAAPAAASDSFGLEAIRERARQLGGDVTIESAPGAGTRLRVTIPVRSG